MDTYPIILIVTFGQSLTTGSDLIRANKVMIKTLGGKSCPKLHSKTKDW